MLVPYDHPTMEYTKKIGYEPHIIEGGFDGFLIVKAHAGTGTLIPGTNKTTGDVAEEEQEAEADKEFPAEEAAGHLDVHTHDAGEGEPAEGKHCHCHDHEHDHEHGEHSHEHHHHEHVVDESVDADHPYVLKPGEYEMNGALHRPDGSHSHDGGRTWHTH